MSELMRAAAVVGEKQVEIKKVAKPVPGPGEVLVKVKACALCTWEQRVFTGESKMPLPFVGGHEVSGVIEEVGPGVYTRAVGEKVALRLLDTCGECYYCRQGEENLCVNIGKGNGKDRGYSGPGGLGEYLVAKTSQVFKMNDELPFVHATFAEPLACVIHSIRRANMQIGDDVVVVGAGIMGLLHVMLAKKQAARVIVSELSEERRELAEQLGTDITINPAEIDVVEKVKELTEGRGADVVFHTTALPQVAEQAIRMVGKMGRVLMYGSFHPDGEIPISPNWLHYSEVVLTGSVSPAVIDFQKSTKLLSARIIDPRLLISKTYTLEDAADAFNAAIRPDTYRIIVEP